MNEYICTNKNKAYQIEVENILNSRKKEILDFFEVEDDPKFSFSIYIYDTIEDLIKGLEKRGFQKDPDYMCACFKDEDKTINLFEPKDDEWSKKEYEKVIFHEEIHAIQYAIYGSQPEWLTEGIAKYLDGTYQRGIDWLMKNYINQQPIPSMEELTNEFGMHEYDSYDYAYSMVSFLLETLGKKEFLRTIGNKQKLEVLSTNLVDSTINYYNQKYKENKRR